MDPRMIFFFMTEFAGFVMVVGGMWLIYKQKIYIDKESSQPIEVKLPGNITLKSNYPALALFVLGFFPLIYPFHELTQLQEYQRVVTVKLTGMPKTSIYPALVYASVTPYPVTQDGDSFSVPVPFIGLHSQQEYKVLLIANDQVLDRKTVTQDLVQSSHGDIPITFTPAVIAPSEYKVVSAPTPDGFK